jgi:hypothetical protein
MVWERRKKKRSKQGRRKKAERRGEIIDGRKEGKSELRKEMEETSIGGTEVKIMI